MTDSRLAAAILAFSVLFAAVPARAEDTITFKASYGISISGIVVGEADAESRFNGNSYVAAISGSTSGPSRLVSDATARLAGSGHFYGSRVSPSSYTLETNENGFQTHVRMGMQSGKIVDLLAAPGLLPAKDRVPITDRQKLDVVDPMGAFLVPIDRPGAPSARRACTRTIKVFDGWTRYDIQLSYKATRVVDGGPDTYAGPIAICSARYIPVAGHRASGKSVQSMAQNTRLEVWLAPLKGMPVLIPYRIVIGTDLGDLVVFALNFHVDGPERHADAK